MIFGYQNVKHSSRSLWISDKEKKASDLKLGVTPDEVELLTHHFDDLKKDLKVNEASIAEINKRKHKLLINKS